MRTQGSRPRPRTQNKSEAKPRTALPRTDPLEAKDQGHKHKCSLKKRSSKIFFRRSQKKKRKKRSSKKFFRRFPSKKLLLNFFFQASYKISRTQKKCCPLAEDRAIFEDFRSRDQGQGIETSRPRTSKCVLEAKDVLEDSTSNNNMPQITPM